MSEGVRVADFSKWSRESLEQVAAEMLGRLTVCDRCGCDGNETPCDSCSMTESAAAKRRIQLAAPKLLAALQRAHDWIQRDEETHGRTFGVGNEIRDAIKLATGKRPESRV